MKTKETKDFGDVVISSDFECGSGISFQRLNKNHFRIRIPADPPNSVGGGYSWYFCVNITNAGKSRLDFTLDALCLSSQGSNNYSSTLLPVFISKNFSKWESIKPIKMSQSYDYKLDMRLEPNESLYISNSLPYRYSKMCEWLKKICFTHENVTTIQFIGESSQGRKIYLLSIAEQSKQYNNKDRILITSGMHPAEPDWLATTSIIEKLLSDEPWARDARRRYIFDVIPQLNPDGFVLGTNGCNANGINPYWDFRPYDYKNSPETAYLWKWIETHPPAIYLDFHCYVHQIKKDYQPYLKPISDYHQPGIRRIVSELDNRLLMLSQGRAIRGDITNLPSTLAYQITGKYDTITYTKYHLHLKHGVEHCRDLGLSVLKTIIEGIKSYEKISDLQIERTSRNFKWFLRINLMKIMTIKNYFKKTKKRFKEWKNNFEVKKYYGTLWYEDVCKYFSISKEGAIKRATSPKRKSKLIWEDKEEIEKSERNVINAWKKDENMVIRNAWYRERNIVIRWDKLLKNLNYKKGERILDYGCGISSFTKWALRHGRFDITLADIDGPLLKFCKWRYGKKVTYCKIGLGKEGLPLKERYDITLCIDVLEHVWSPLDVVEHLCSHLNVQGRLIETFIDDSTGSNLRKANEERPLVFNYLNKHLKLISGSLDSAGPRIWLKK